MEIFRLTRELNPFLLKYIADVWALPILLLNTLDEIKASRNVGSVGCIKIDVEGHELSVLEGASKTIEQDRPVIMIEIEQRHHVEPINHIFDWFDKRDYVGYFFDMKSRSFVALQHFNVEMYQNPEAFKTGEYANNFTFVPMGMTIPQGHIDL